MASKDVVKRAVCEAIDRNAGRIISLGETIRRNPELGFKEPYMGGASGSGHGADYTIADTSLAYVEPAKQLALMAVDMLWGDAGAARDILQGWKPRMTKEEYLAFQRGIARTERFDGAK